MFYCFELLTLNHIELTRQSLTLNTLSKTKVLNFFILTGTAGTIKSLF